MTKILVTSGQGYFEEQEWARPPCGEMEIAVKSILTGVCRSDIDMMEGNFGPLPRHMSGHEGLGQVIEVGSKIDSVQIGDYVATRGEPAYADEYNVRDTEFVVVPAAEPKYILEPVACGINLVESAGDLIKERSGPNARLLILGTGFLAWVAYNTLLLKGFEFDIDVVGRSNKDIWGNKLKDKHIGTYDVIIDLSGGTILFDQVIYNENAVIVFGAQKKVTTDFSGMLWKAVTMVFPSPRNKSFYDCMKTAKRWIEYGNLNVDKFWSKSYNRNTEWQQAFIDGANRPNNYSRGYIKWN